MQPGETIFRRRATRGYTAQSVGEQTIQAPILAAVHAPSAVNQQPWAFTVVRDQQILASISKSAEAHVRAAAPPSTASDRVHGRVGTPNSIFSTTLPL